MKTKVFIDGKAGTTGLRIYERLSVRDDVEILQLSDELRKDTACRKEALNSADVAFLCLPDSAAIEAVSLVENPDTVVIDASTAHRTADGWAYGFPELGEKFADKVAKGKRIAVPGCHASGFIALVQPLVEQGIIAPSAKLVCHSLTGYSGGGKQMIAQYQAEGDSLHAPRQYGLSQTHKHLKEMTAICKLDTPPAFCPVVCDFYSGMEVSVALFADDLQKGAKAGDIKDLYRNMYDGDIVFYRENCDENGFLSAGRYSGKDCMEISVHGSADRILLAARYDNLGKGASGAAVECMNIVLGKPASYGLEL